MEHQFGSDSYKSGKGRHIVFIEFMRWHIGFTSADYVYVYSIYMCHTVLTKYLMSMLAICDKMGLTKKQILNHIPDGSHDFV